MQLAAQRTPLFLTRLGNQTRPARWAPFIVGVSSDGTHFVDQGGSPRLFIGEDCWNVVWEGPNWNADNYQGTYDSYLTSRANQGYTAVEISVFSYPNATNPVGSPSNGTDWDGTWPFTSTNNPSSGFNETFWKRRDYFIAKAATLGITPVINLTTPSSADANSIVNGWTSQQWTDYGTGIGNRYKDMPNIMWIFGDDYFGTLDTGFNACRTAIRAAGDTHAISIQNAGETTSRLDLFSGTKDPNGFDIHAEYEWGYSYNVSYDVVEKMQTYVPTASDDKQSVIPPLWADGFYLASGVGANQTDVRLERQLIWWALSSGAAGISTGDNDIWPWGSGAAAAVTSKTFYSAVMPAIVRAFSSLTGWQRLIPDTGNQLPQTGRGTHAAAIERPNQYIANTDDYVTASRTPDNGSGSVLAVLYCGKAMNITIDESKMKTGYTATWIDPLDGSFHAGTVGSSYNSASQVGNNSAGDPDWVLVLRG